MASREGTRLLPIHPYFEDVHLALASQNKPLRRTKVPFPNRDRVICKTGEVGSSR